LYVRGSASLDGNNVRWPRCTGEEGNSVGLAFVAQAPGYGVAGPDGNVPGEEGVKQDCVFAASSKDIQLTNARSRCGGRRDENLYRFRYGLGYSLSHGLYYRCWVAAACSDEKY
jgi:hypothetical protein